MDQTLINAALRELVAPERNYTPTEFALGWQEPPWLTPETRRMHSEAQLLLNDIIHRQKARWLTLCGQSGCGKTHLAKAAVNVLRNTGRQAQCWPMSKIASMLRDGEYGLTDHLCEVRFLALDDLGAEQMSEFVRAQLYQVLNARLGKWTLITSNLSVHEIGDSIDIRIASRIHRGRNVVVEASDAEDFCLRAKQELSLTK